MIQGFDNWLTTDPNDDRYTAIENFNTHLFENEELAQAFEDADDDVYAEVEKEVDNYIEKNNVDLELMVHMQRLYEQRKAGKFKTASDDNGFTLLMYDAKLAVLAKHLINIRTSLINRSK